MGALLGLTDLPAKEDNFQISSYHDSMAKFIMNCNTPMTISVQGTWGTGKTTFMRMVSQKLEGCKFIEFNTWQCSQFDMDGVLSVNLIRSLIDDMGLDEEQKTGINKIIRGVGTATRMGVSILAEKVFKNGTLGGTVGEIMTRIGEAILDNGEDNPIEEIKKIKEEFKKCVDESLKKNHASRLVIFIDDLDRLEPRKAVELLEVLKNFLDCEKCVFVLAIDYDVVCKGVAAKYGEAGGTAALDRKKGKDFFDKIIQVPFKMPVAQYSTDGYLEECLKKIVFKDKPLFGKTETFDAYYSFTAKSVGTNPRAIKRLVNSFQLLVMVVESKGDLDISKDKLLVFAILCLQELDLNVYNAIVRKRKTITEDMLMAFVNSDVKQLADFFPGLILDENEEDCIDLERVAGFIQSLMEIINTDNQPGLSEKEMEVFRAVLDLSAITSTDSEPISTRRGSLILSDAAELDMGTLSRDEIKKLCDMFSALGDVAIEPIQSKTGKVKDNHIAVRTGDHNGPIFADVYERKNGYNIDCFVPDAKIFSDEENYPEIADWVKNHKYRPSGKRLSPAAYSDEEKASLNGFVKDVFAVWQRYLNEKQSV